MRVFVTGAAAIIFVILVALLLFGPGVIDWWEHKQRVEALRARYDSEVQSCRSLDRSLRANLQRGARQTAPEPQESCSNPNKG